MHIKRLFLRDFRNYERADLSLAPTLNLVLGPNGSGKTNLVEAMYLLATARSHRTHRTGDIIRWGQQQFHVKALLQGEHVRDQSLELIYHRDGRKAARRSGIPIERIRDFVGHLRVVIFTPDDLQMVKGGPERRRDWLDALLPQVRPVYTGWQLEYERALAQRNEALRMGDVSLVSIWDETLARTGSRLTVLRHRCCEWSGPVVQKAYKRLGGRKALTLGYQSGIGGGNETYNGNTISESMQRGEDEVHALYRQVLEESRLEDRERGYTLRGPHRDEVELLLDERPIRRYGSQGQQRSTVLALKLAEMAYLEEMTGSRPVLLLDDVLSELDEQRAAALMEKLTAPEAGCQVLVTAAAEPRPDEVWRNAVRFRVSAGRAVREDPG